MRILKSLGFVVLAGVYVYLVRFIPFEVAKWVFGVIAFIAVFLYGYLLLFNPNK